MSSPESQELIYRFPAQSQPHPRPESPNSHLIHHLSTHNDQYIPTSHQTMYNSSQPSLDFSAPPNDGDTQPQQQHVPSDGFDIYTNSPTFRNYFTNRYRQPMAPANSSSFANEAAGPFTQPFNITAAEVFGTHQPMSPPSQQQTQPGDGIQSVRGFEYPTQTPGSGSNGLKSNSKPIFANLDPFGSSVGGSALLQSHQVAKSSLPQPPQSQSQQQPAYHTPAQNSNQSFMNGLLHTQSQTPYGPHVPSTASGTGTSGPGLPHTSGISVNASQEEISTIFVVGFPEDMQEREFQNMFTFSPGFEAATLKIPNKDSTAYGPGTAGAGASTLTTGALRPGFQIGYPQSSYTGSNDPYNLVTLNQGGVVVDGRDGTTSSWPAAVSGSDETGYGRNGLAGDLGGMGVGHLPNSSAVPPRKQIIGFAKFRTRVEALAARDVLQGRRVDIEKGAVLKAEMAKKNLHTKRGVGPLGSLPLSSIMNGGGGGGVVPAEALAGMTGLNAMSSLTSPIGEALSARERELGALGAMGLGGVAQRRDRMDPHEEEREHERETRRRRELGSISSVGGMPMMNSRGPRERAEEDERERERRRKEKEVERNARLRSSNSTAFDAFHSVGVQPNGLPLRNPSLITSSQQAVFSVGNAMLSPTENPNAYPFSPNGLSQHENFSPTMDGWPVGPNGGRRLGSTTTNGILRSLPTTMTTTLNHKSSSSNQSSPPDTTTESSFPQLAPQQGSSRSGLSDSGHSQISGAQYSPPMNAVALPSHPSLPSRPRPLSPNNEANFQGYQQSQTQHPTNSSSSSISGSQSSSSSIEDEMSRTMGGMNISTHQGMISPQLPSPASGGSSGARANASDQNPPINTLYVGNLPTSPVPAGYPPDYLEESLRRLFMRCPGFRKLCFRQKSNGPMCFVEFDDVSYATKALNELYGHQLSGLVKGGIRLSYSKNPLGVRTPTNAVNGGGLQQQQHTAQQTFGANSNYTGMQDAFSPRMSNGAVLSVDTGVLRGLHRDPAEVISPSSSLYHYATSPPPRFFSPQPSCGFALSPTGGSSGFQRTSTQGYGLSATSSSFSPFGSLHTTAQQAPGESIEHIPTTLSSTPSIEAARAG